MTVHRPDELFARLGRDQLIGFGEAYLTGAWDAEDLAGFLTVLAAELPTLVPASLQRLRAAVVHRPPQAQRNTETNTRGNIAHHYDLSNDLFELFLDPTLSYSSALFGDGVVDHGDHLVAAAPTDTGDLAAAQARKIERLLDEAQVGAGSRVLEIGTGWGELAIRAARRGASVHSVTLSSEQQTLARAADRRRRPGRPGRGRAVRLPRLSTGTGTASGTTRSCRWRWSRRSATSTGRRTSPRSTGCWRRAAGPSSRRSRCRTTGCWPPATPTRGSTSTSSPAASCPRSRSSTRSPASTRRCG